MYEMEHYKTIAPPTPSFIVGQDVAIRRYYSSAVVFGTITKVNQVWMKVTLDKHPKHNRIEIEEFNRNTFRARNSSDYLIIPELEEYKVQLDAAESYIKNAGIEFHYGSGLRNNDAITFYLADALKDFHGATDEKA
jgi:hypothetical protein